jgi:aconitase A
MNAFSGKVLFLDRSDINTDEIIPAKYLTEISRDALAPHLLEDLSLEEFDPAMDIAGKSALILTRANFGCGSSREHAPWALEGQRHQPGGRRKLCPHLPPEHVQLRHDGRGTAQSDHRYVVPAICR